MRTCTIGDCRRKHYARGYCPLHYKRWLIHGDPRQVDIKPQRLRLYCEMVVASPAPPDECMDWPFGVTSAGYGQFSTDGTKGLCAHRYVCQLAHGDPPSAKHQAAHSCGRRICVNPHHLRWATPTDNERDKVAHGTHTRGERSGSCKLTRDDVHEIRGLISEGVMQRHIAPRFGVARTTIGSISTGESWGWLP